MVARDAQCHEHSGMVVEVKGIRSELHGLRRKLDRVEKLLWALVASIGAGATAMGLSPEVAQKAVALLVGAP